MSDTRSRPAGRPVPPAVRPLTIVTGGARGIGAATVAHLARAGHDLIVGYRDDRAAAERAAAAAQDHGVRAVAVAGDVTAHDYVHYAAAKAGVEAMTVGLAKEVADQGIRVNAVAPGTVHTRIHADAGDPDRAGRAAARIPLGRAGEPDEIAPAIVWLLGSEASYVTGASIRAAGGL
ncbi:SDR family oxidoreductase [Streptomyces durocortorensis]|uniref:SDR family oxidoreductase n=1 Tax=Streptomyces durocortorensis TaxID=2811104 RepID=A0ABS2HT96_9ACTN|nr:SDR family oxidoreductase [Streptomyces durocortorensis]MBM7053942.1 SDR family oxidoreductase [Streptomyces durocortorensis]